MKALSGQDLPFPAKVSPTGQSLPLPDKASARTASHRRRRANASENGCPCRRRRATSIYDTKPSRLWFLSEMSPNNSNSTPL
ncbi:hypothetical protein HMPREF0972_00681 [Actinomyces sp. oral taxon 848 str. F0332]|nr:hypothetical protein HMPREF0972_00681 [Actinomyces sp. oral taxon 848 str. F0332]